MTRFASLFNSLLCSMRSHWHPLALGAAVGVALTAAVVGGSEMLSRVQQSAVVATVNDAQITMADFHGGLRRESGAAALRQLVDHILLERRARELRIQVSKKVLDARLKQAIAQVGTEEAFEQRLAAQHRTKEDELRDLRYEALLDEIAARETEVTPEQIGRYYEEHKAQFSHKGRVKARLMLLETRQNAEELYKVLQEGGPFDTWAKLMSVDPGSRGKGGDLGWIERDDYAKQITDVAFSLDEGEFSEPFQAPDGWAIVKCEGTEAGAPKPLSEVKDDVEALLRSRLTSKHRATWLAEARRKAGVRIYDEQLRRMYKALEEAEAQQPTLFGWLP